MDKVKEALHIGSSRKNKTGEDNTAAAAALAREDIANDHERRDSHDSELEAMTAEERVAYLKEFEYAEKHGAPKQGSFLDRLISRGNKKTEDDIAREYQERQLAEQARANQAPQGQLRQGY